MPQWRTYFSLIATVYNLCVHQLWHYKTSLVKAHNMLTISLKSQIRQHKSTLYQQLWEWPLEIHKSYYNFKGLIKSHESFISPFYINDARKCAAVICVRQTQIQSYSRIHMNKSAIKCVNRCKLPTAFCCWSHKALGIMRWEIFNFDFP